MRQLVLITAVLAMHAPATAQDLEAARHAFERGEAQFEAGNYQLALDSFRESQAALEGDEPRQILIEFNIARSLEELGRYDDARDSFRDFLTRAPVDAPYREETEERVRELDARLAATDDRSPNDEGLLIAGAVTLGVGALTALVAIPTGVATLDARSGLEAACPGGDCAPSQQDRLNEAHTLATATDVLWISGAAIAATGAILLAIGLTDSADSEDGSVDVSAACAPTSGCHASLRGNF